MQSSTVRAILVVAGIVLIALAVFGEPIREAVGFPLGPPNPGFGPTQWTILVLGVIVASAGIVFPTRIAEALRRQPKGPSQGA